MRNFSYFYLLLYLGYVKNEIKLFMLLLKFNYCIYGEYVYGFYYYFIINCYNYYFYLYIFVCKLNYYFRVDFLEMKL